MIAEDTPGLEGVADLLPTNRFRGLVAFVDLFGLGSSVIVGRSLGGLGQAYFSFWYTCHGAHINSKWSRHSSCTSFPLHIPTYKAEQSYLIQSLNRNPPGEPCLSTGVSDHYDCSQKWRARAMRNASIMRNEGMVRETASLSLRRAPLRGKLLLQCIFDV